MKSSRHSKSRGIRGVVAVIAVLALVAAACGEDDPEQIAADIDDPGTDQGRFDGVELVVAGPAGQLDYMKSQVDQWAEETGAEVRVDEIPFGEINERVMSALRTDTFLADVINIGTNLGGDLMGGDLVLPAPDWVLDRVEFDDVLPIFREQSYSWGGTVYGTPWDGDVLFYFYRSDAFEQFASDFQDEHNRPLEPATTWDEYAEIAAFFTGWDWTGEGDGYGLVELPMRGNQGWNGFMTRATAYAKAPDDPGFFFDPDTMEARIDNPGFVRALEDWVEVMDYGPPGMTNFGWIENAQTFTSGLAAQNLQWADIGPMSRGEDSEIEGGVGFALAPGVDEYFDPQAEAWVDAADEPNRAPFMGFGGWINLVPTNTRNAQAAFDLASYLGSPEVNLAGTMDPSSGVNPFRRSMLEPEPWVEEGWPEDDAEAYVDAILGSLEHPNAVFDMRLPGFPEYRDAVEVAVSEALAGQSEPADALAAAAEEWEAITDRFGRDEQRTLYRQALGLED